VACTLADEGLVEITQRGVVVDGRTTPGPVRIRLVEQDPARSAAHDGEGRDALPA
jgi:hypothetical protein